MNEEERYAVVQKLHEVCNRYEQDWQMIDALMKSESIHYDFYEDLYEILYHFPCDEHRLLARVFQLFEQQAITSTKNKEK